MKKIIILIILIVMCKSLFAQRDTIPPFPFTKWSNKWYRAMNYISWDSIALMSLTDTTQLPYRAGGFTIWQHDGIDTAMWFYDGLKWKQVGEGAISNPQNIQQTLIIGRDLIQVDYIQSNSHFKLTSTTAPIYIQAKGQGLGIQNYTGQPRITFKNDTGETPVPEAGGMISGSANGGAIVFGNNFTLDTIDNRYLKLGMIDNDLNFTPYTIMNEHLGIANSYNYAVNRFYDSVFTYYVPNGDPDTDSILVESGGLIKKIAPGGGGGGGSITANNGLTMSTATNVQLGGTLLQNTTIEAGLFALLINTTDAVGVAPLQVTTSNATTAISADAANGSAILATGLVGVTAYSSGNSGITINASSGAAAMKAFGENGVNTHWESSYSSTTGIETMLEIVRRSSSTVSNGVGLEISLNNNTSTGVYAESNSITSLWTDATDATRTSQLILSGVNSASTQNLLTLNGNGSMQLNQYIGGAFSGTPAYCLAVDASGNVIVTTCGGSASTLTRQVITSGTSSTVTGGNYIVTIDPASTLATYTLTLPASPSDLDIVQVDFGGTLTSGMIVTTLVISPNSGQTILDNTPPPSATADNTLFYRYRSANTTWYRFKP